MRCSSSAPLTVKVREKMYRKEQPETSHKGLSYRTNHKVGSHSRELQRLGAGGHRGTAAKNLLWNVSFVTAGYTMKAEAVKITDGVYWVGVLDWDIRSYHGYTLHGTTYLSLIHISE